MRCPVFHGDEPEQMYLQGGISDSQGRWPLADLAKVWENRISPLPYGIRALEHQYTYEEDEEPLFAILIERLIGGMLSPSWCALERAEKA